LDDKSNVDRFLFSPVFSLHSAADKAMKKDYIFCLSSSEGNRIRQKHSYNVYKNNSIYKT
jgi:hypothetical protein